MQTKCRKENMHFYLHSVMQIKEIKLHFVANLDANKFIKNKSYIFVEIFKCKQSIKIKVTFLIIYLLHLM